MPMITAMSAATPTRGRRKSAAHRIASSTAAVPTRRRRLGNVRALCLLELLARAPEAPLARAIGFDRRVERRTVEVRPQRLGEVELRIGELPEEEVADS